MSKRHTQIVLNADEFRDVILASILNATPPILHDGEMEALRAASMVSTMTGRPPTTNGEVKVTINVDSSPFKREIIVTLDYAAVVRAIEEYLFNYITPQKYDKVEAEFVEKDRSQPYFCLVVCTDLSDKPLASNFPVVG